ncbi:hypothetical protein D5086_028301 [Populus alba]|uniref:Uncharacterized protein n=1 Tax=Populus alba TaxID=43335 RepID=A0ACC4AY89_POPAL
MAFLLKNCSSSISSHLRSKSQKTQDALSISRRGFHVEPGPREKALLAEDPALKCFKSHKKSVWRLKRAGDVLTLVVVADEYSSEPQASWKDNHFNTRDSSISAPLCLVNSSFCGLCQQEPSTEMLDNCEEQPREVS